MSKLGGSSDGGAAQAAAARQQDEAARQAKVNEGLASINQSFAGFDDDFFNQRSQARNDYYLPQLQDQFEDSRQDLTTQLARAGLLKSTAANSAFTDLQQQYDLQRGNILNQSETDLSNYRAQINANRNSLISQLQANANPEIAASQAFAASNNLRNAAPDFSPLANVLTPAATAGALFLNANRERELLNNAPTATDPRSGGGAFTVGRG